MSTKIEVSEPRSKIRRFRRLISNISVAVISIFVILVLIELSLSLFYPVSYFRPPKRLPDKAWGQLIHQKSTISGLNYELNPGKIGYSRRAKTHININSFGMRDSEPYRENDRTVRRIVVIGDSNTFGFGVKGKNTYSNILERLLNGDKKSKQIDVLNFGVGGYSSKDEAVVLKHKGLQWNPELVIVGYSLNDPEIDPIQPLHSYFQKPCWWQHFNVTRLVARGKYFWELKKWGKGDYFRYLHAPEKEKWKSVLQAFADISDMTKARKIPVLLLIFPKTGVKPWSQYPYLDLHRQVADAAENQGFYVIDLFDTFSKYPHRKLMISPRDSHPTVFGHKLVAKEVKDWMGKHKHLFSFPL